MSQALLYGIHDREGRHLVPPGGWCVDTRALSELHPPTDYAALRGDINWIVRLNHGYGSTGTIPLPDQYQQFAAACANYVAKSRGAQRWIIGNEPNHQQERPNGVYITPADYARCFALCRDAIKRYVPDAQVIPAAVAPYHADPMPWVDYLTEMLHLIAESGGCDGLAIHTYTRSSDPADIESGALMGPPLQSTYSGFMSYLDALDCVPPSMFRLPVYITEFNELLPGGWHDANTGVVQAAYADIDDTNHSGTNYLPIMCLCLYRWPKYDQWFIEGKQGVIDDFVAAVGRGYASPVMRTQTVTETTFIPVVSPGTVAASDLPARDWDERLTQRGVIVETPPLAPGQRFWRVTRARWYDVRQSQGRHHIYVTAPDGTPFRVEWPNGSASGKANGRDAFDAGNFPMSKSLNEFSVRIDDGTPSETLKGIGMGADGNSGEHTSTGVTFALATMPAASQSTPRVTTHLPSINNGTPPDDRWQRSREFVRRWEGDYSDNPEDHGNWTGGEKGKGELKGTRYGISAASYPHLDIRNLTMQQADAIYFKDYWQASGADKLPWPYCLLAFDTAVLHGVSTSRKWQAEAGDNAFAFAAKRLRTYTKLDNWHYFGAGWTNRVADLLEVAGQ